ncbi:hypothetical protein [Xanthomarina gelatinilytica]|uniref:hypothetical protein n=1 Tax=Xanthomarina gelatinilytica TaxID=1137281 RepID=UPI003AA8F727
MKYFKFIIPVLLFLLSCNSILKKEVGRLKINKLSTESNLVIEQTELNLKKDDDIKVWSDIDIEYEGDVTLMFRIEILKDDENLGVLEVDPMEKSVTIGELKTSIMGKTNWSFTGKNSNITIEEDGIYTFRGLLVSSENPSLTITKAEIVLKK